MRTKAGTAKAVSQRYQNSLCTLCWMMATVVKNVYDCRSLMNIPFTISKGAELEKQFLSEATKAGMVHFPSSLFLDKISSESFPSCWHIRDTWSAGFDVVVAKCINGLCYPQFWACHLLRCAHQSSAESLLCPYHPQLRMKIPSVLSSLDEYKIEAVVLFMRLVLKFSLTYDLKYGPAMPHSHHHLSRSLFCVVTI